LFKKNSDEDYVYERNKNDALDDLDKTASIITL